MNDKVAVVGISCIVPGANQYNELWDNLINKKESITHIKTANDGDEKWPHIGAFGSIGNVQEMAVLGIDERLVPFVDPQLSLLYTLVGQAVGDCRGNISVEEGRTGVFCCSDSSFEWRKAIVLPDDLQNPYYLKELSYVSDNQYYSSMISYLYGFMGQSVGVCASCASSLAAVHMAVSSLLLGDIDCGIAGGVSIQPSHKNGYFYDERLIYSKSGKCRTFDQDADGTVPSDGGGIVVLKRLEDAVADGDRIYSVIPGSAVNNDGRRKMGYTVPSIDGISEAIQCSMDISGIKAEQISFLEFHGTGTHFGDCIEFTAFTEALNTSRRNFCAIGSVKPNIGYLECASGVVGLIKTVLSVYHKIFPATIHLQNVNKDIDIENSPFYINTENVYFRGDKIIGGVNAYGDGGNNMFMLVEGF